MQSIEGIIQTPPLWLKQQFGLKQFDLPEIDATQISAYTPPTNLRLGHQVEHIISHLLRADPTYDIILQNVQLKRDQITIGEIDYILKEKSTGRYIHLELACKFYLVDPKISEPVYRLIGPNRRDMFFTKMEKIKEHQFPLLYTQEGLQVLEENHIDVHKINQEVLFLGNLFMPYQKATPSIRPLNTSCIVGSWISWSDFSAVEFGKDFFYLPQKFEWIHLPHDGVNWLSYEAARMEVNLRLLRESSPMVWRKRKEGLIEKLFVVWW